MPVRGNPRSHLERGEHPERWEAYDPWKDRDWATVHPRLPRTDATMVGAGRKRTICGKLNMPDMAASGATEREG
jgi:hypothetical protein